MCRRTTTAVSGSCGQQPRIARSRAGSAQTGAPICSPPFGLLSEQRRGADSMHIRRSAPSWTGNPSFNRVEQLPFGGLLVAPALDKDIENVAFLVNSAPEPVLLAGDGDHDLIEVPLVAAAGGSPTDAVGEFPTEFQAPLPDRLVCDRDAASRQHLLDHAQAQREPEIQPDRIADELGGIAIACIKRVSGRRHPAQISDYPGSAKPEAAQLDGASRMPFELLSRLEFSAMATSRAANMPHSKRDAALSKAASGALTLSVIWYILVAPIQSPCSSR